MSLMLHAMLWTEACQFAEDFWRTSYARITFPNAKLKSQRVSEFLAELGDEATYRRFFDAYLGYVASKTKTKKHSILVDSTGLQNDSQMELTAVNVHNGLKSNEVRLILVLDRQTGFPLYFRYVKGNVLDVNSLKNTISDLNRYGINVDHCILDAGYYCGDNIEDLNHSEIPYLLRFRAGNLIYDELVKGHVDGLDSYGNRVVYGDRVIFIKCVPIEIHGGQAFAYVSIDHDAQADGRRRIYMKNPNEFKSEADRDDMIRNSGVFILISKNKVSNNEILPLYYSRQAIEQVFDFGKNYANLLPLRTHGEPTFRGHLLVSFMATVSIMTLDKLFAAAHPKSKKKKTLNFIQARSCLRQMKCCVYDDHVSIVEPDRRSNDVLKDLNIQYQGIIAR
jgi:transposase